MAFCFPTGCLKAFIGVGSVITILIAIAMLGATIYANVQKGKIIDKGDIDMANGALVGLYVASIVFLIMGIAGLYGSIKKSKFLLSLFAVGTFIFILVFIAGTLLFFLAPKTIFDGSCEDSKTSWLVDLFKMNTEAQNILCSQYCQCNFANSDNIYTPEQQDYLKNASSTSGVTQVQKCPSFQQQNFSQANILFMSTLQAQFQCGGWCNNNYQIFYYYSNISAGPKPTQGCYSAIKGFFDKNGILLGIGCAAAMTFALLNMIMICCLCFHPSKTGNRSDFYKRMVEDD